MKPFENLKKKLERTAERPSLCEWLAETRKIRPIRKGQTAAQLIRELRDSR